MNIQREMIKIYIGGELFEVPEGSTIISAMEYAGFQLKKGVGCREGYCGACATVYREKGDYKLKGGLACQTVVTDGMAVAMIPFVPAEKPTYDLNDLEPDVSTFTKLFPTVFIGTNINFTNNSPLFFILVNPIINLDIITIFSDCGCFARLFVLPGRPDFNDFSME